MEKLSGSDYLLQSHWKNSTHLGFKVLKNICLPSKNGLFSKDFGSKMTKFWSRHFPLVRINNSFFFLWAKSRVVSWLVTNRFTGLASYKNVSFFFSSLSFGLKHAERAWPRSVLPGSPVYIQGLFWWDFRISLGSRPWREHTWRNMLQKGPFWGGERGSQLYYGGRELCELWCQCSQESFCNYIYTWVRA